MADHTTALPPQKGTWTLVAPDGRSWEADSPLAACGKEQRERIPASLALERIFRGMHDECTAEEKNRYYRRVEVRIWKWTLAVTDRQSLQMPVGAKLLTVQTQNEMPQLWALCNPDAPKEMRTFGIHGTGNPMPDDPGEYVATFQIHGGSLVFHVFETIA